MSESAVHRHKMSEYVTLSAVSAIVIAAIVAKYLLFKNRTSHCPDT